MNCNNFYCKYLSSWLKPVRLGVTILAVFVIAAPAMALPVNPTVISGTVSFNQTSNVLTVTNRNGTIITWKKFSIPPGDTTRFFQPTASHSVFNRVLNVPTAIYGKLSPNDINQQGGINTPVGGSVYLTGAEIPSMGINPASTGATILAAGATVSLIDRATPGVKVEVIGAKNGATNLGAIMAEVGRVGIAGAMVRDSARPGVAKIVSEGGRIFLRAGPDGQIPR